QPQPQPQRPQPGAAPPQPGPEVSEGCRGSAWGRRARAVFGRRRAGSRDTPAAPAGCVGGGAEDVAGKARAPPSGGPASRRPVAGTLAQAMEELDRTINEPLEARKKIFRELQRKLHPDKNPDQEDGAKFAFQKLMERRGVYLA
ncbi:unnamed protein product, partial [Prorocentrum cordatum]